MNKWIEKRQLFYSDKTQGNSKTNIEVCYISIPINSNNNSSISYGDIQIKISITNSEDSTNRFCILLNLTQAIYFYYEILMKPKDIIQLFESKNKDIRRYQHITDNNLEITFGKTTSETNDIIFKPKTKQSTNNTFISIPLNTYRAIYLIISGFINNFSSLNNTFIIQEVLMKFISDPSSSRNNDENFGNRLDYTTYPSTGSTPGHRQKTFNKKKPF